MIVTPSALPLGRFGARIAPPDRDQVAAEIARLSALLVGSTGSANAPSGWPVPASTTAGARATGL